MRYNTLLAECLSSPKEAVFKTQSFAHQLLKGLCLLIGLLLLMPALAFGKGEKPFDAAVAYYSTKGYDDYGAFVEFVAEVSDLDGLDTWTTTGQLFATVDGTRFQILNFTSADRDNYYGNFYVTSGYGRARGLNENNWTSLMNSASAQVRVRDGTSGDRTTLVMRWYVPTYYFGKSIKYSVHDYVDEAGDDVGARDYDLTTQTVDNPIPNATIGTITTLPSRPGYMVVPYSYSSNVGPSDYYKLTHYLLTYSITDNTISSPSGSFEVPMSNAVRTPNFVSRTESTLGAPINLVHFRSEKLQPITIPAYQWPTSLTPTYNASTGIVTVSWNVPSLSGADPASIIRGDNFELQRSTDNTFPSDKTTTYTIPYGTDISAYSKGDDLSELNVQGTVYYRLRRTKTSNDWEWREVRSGSLPLQTTLLSVNSPDSVKLDQSGPSPKAILKWNVTNGVWPRGSKFIIRRFSRTSGGSSSNIDIALTDTELKSGQYEDENISFCTRYSYSLLVQPGSSNYPAPAEVKIPGDAVAIEIGTISNLTASKGYHPDRVGLQWHSEGGFSNYLILRSATGTIANSLQIATVPSASVAGADLLFEDSRGTPGIYYTYFVQGISDCGGVVRKTAALASVGFRSPTGTVYGRITYESGQAVENVAVRLQSNAQAQSGQSVLLNGSANSYLKLDSLKSPFEDSAFTVEAWIKPTDAAPANQVLFSRGGQYELGFDNAGKLYFTFNNTNIVTGNYSNINQTFVHVAAVHRKDSMFLLLNDMVIGNLAVSYKASTPQKQVYLGSNAAGSNFKGHLDEVRAWNIALSPTTIARDYTRLVAGNEDGLVAYWRLDESIADQFYDASHQGDEYNQNDGFMDPQQVIRSKTIPTTEQLALKAYSDATGNYMVTGIPYTGNGTTYTIAPLLGTHQFDPMSVNRLISASSSEFTVDFKDKSSFPVSGFVYYYNSTVPVSGVQFKIDGKLAQQTNGTIIETNEAGQFEISVPVGVHEVQAVKNNHNFANNGRITNLAGNNLNYQNTLAGVELYDSTTIRFIGRVAGGAIQEALPLGHSVSVNNLGKQLSITMKLPSGNKYNLYAGNTPNVVINQHLLPSNESDSSKIHKTRVVYQTNQITIYPDSLTGEFMADLIPEKFLASNVIATGWGDILDGSQPTIDFTDQLSLQSSARAFVDSLRNNQGAWVTTSYLDTVWYNASYKFIKRKTPTVSIDQVDAGGRPVPHFGSLTYQVQTFAGTRETVNVVDPAGSGKAMYLYGRPVFNQSQPYTFLIKAFEAYPFYESVNNNIGVVKQQNNKDVIDNVPTQDGFVSLFNSLRNGATTADTLSLDSDGSGLYTFTAGDPDLASRGVKDFSASIQFGPATTINWQWYGDPKMAAFVMGGKLIGTDFITAGPDKVLMVLRDPPGSKSFSYAEKGSVLTTLTKTSGSFKQAGELEFVKNLGTELVTFTGIGVGTINSVKTSTGSGFGIEHEERFVGTDSKEETTTLTTTFKTSDDPLFVGPPGDVFVGHSTNITFGQSNNITIVKRTEFQEASDIIIHEPSPTSSHLVVQRAGINIGQTFGTLFAYPQQHLEFILIPNLILIRNNALLPLGTSDIDAQQRANNTKKIVYVSKLGAGDPNFGKSNSDTEAFGAGAKTAPYGDGSSYKIFIPTGSTHRADTILTLNQYVQNWKQRMADNEKAKLEATLVQNYSFHSGAPIEYSRETSTTTAYESEYAFVISGNLTNSTDVDILGTGFEFSYKESISTEQVATLGSSKDSSMKFGFTLASEGTDDYFSVDVLKANDSAFVFRTKGGSSGCPYAGKNETKYYQPGLLIDQPTLRNEVPKITVDKAVATDVPSSRKAYYTLYLKNESESRLPATFTLSYVNRDSINGATISVDGLSIANGRVIPIQFGETIEKVLTIERGPTAMDYNDIMILWRSGCQYDPTGYRENIADTVLLSAHFIPSCSDINIKFPNNKWVLNAESPVNLQGKRYLPVTIDQFDVNNGLFERIELQYKPSATSTWITAMKFYADPVKFAAAQGEKQMITNPAAIIYNLLMDDAAFNDQQYDVQAVSYCNLGGSNYVTTESNLVSGIKDTYNPRLFGSPQPANGILTAGEDVRLNFNETIAAGLLTSANFQVTGIRNGAQSSHSVSVRLDGSTSYLATEFEKSYTGKSITAEMWVLPSGLANQTLFSHGSANESLELSLTSDQKMQVTVGGKVVNSAITYPYQAGEWAHVALVYNDISKTVSAYYNFEALVSAAPVNTYTGTGRIEYGRSISKSNNYFNGKIHEARIWNDTLNSVKLQINSLKVLSGAETALLAYYPMNEGKGGVVLDKAHGSHAELNGLWSTPAGKAISLNGNGYVKLNTASAPVLAAMDYTLELWFKGDALQAETTLASNGKGDGTDPNEALNLFSLGFESGLLTFRNNGFKVQAEGMYLDNKWHHVAVAVNRNSGSAQFTVDGKLNQFFDAQNLGGIAAANTFLGARTYATDTNAIVRMFDRHFKGSIDEFRIWNTYLNQSFLTNNNNVRLNGNELGLLAYYPFETYTAFQGVTQLYYSLKDAKVQEVPSVVIPDATVLNGAATEETAPIKDRGPVENLRFDFVVNNDALIINLQEPKQAIDKTMITFKANGIRDLNGNILLSPVTWTAYIDRNQLKWSDREISLVKVVGDPLTFTSYLVNSGGNSQHYTIYNQPSWLSSSPSSGSVDPTGNQKIEFIVNNGLNIGNYEEIIFMRNDNNETEALKVKLQVKGKKPDWLVNAAGYDYNMVVYGKLRLNNIFSVNKEDILGAFVNGKCVGVATNTYTASNNLWYTFLTVYSNEVTNTNVEFRIWQASTGRTFVATPSKTITFANNAVHGTASVPVIFDGSNLLYQDITLNQYWNWVSFNLLIPTATPTNTTLQNGTWTTEDQIKNETAGKGFASYANSGWTGSLKTLDNLSLYKLKVANAQSLPVSGNPVNVKTTAIPLKGAQWSYISYLPQYNATVKEGMAGYQAADEDVIKSQTGFAMYSAQNGWVGSLTFLEPGKGYMLYRKRAADTSFYYPTITGSLVGGRVRGSGVIPNADQRPVPGNFSHSNNMTIIATVGSGFEFRTGDSIIAYVNGEVRGKAKPILNPETNRNTWFFNIGGEAEQSLLFMVERDGNIVAQSSTVIRYSTNAVVGTLVKPLELQFVKNANLITVNPNPFRHATTIQVDVSRLPGAISHEIQVTVFDVAGRPVWSMPLQRVAGSRHTMTWNGKTTNGALCSNGVYFIQVLVNGEQQIYKVIKQ